MTELPTPTTMRVEIQNTAVEMDVKPELLSVGFQHYLEHQLKLTATEKKAREAGVQVGDFGDSGWLWYAHFGGLDTVRHRTMEGVMELLVAVHAAKAWAFHDADNWKLKHNRSRNR